jgi:hypothetical protein
MSVVIEIEFGGGCKREEDRYARDLCLKEIRGAPICERRNPLKPESGLNGAPKFAPRLVLVGSALFL